MSQYATTQQPSSDPPHVDAHDPTGAVPWPTILIEGGEKAGKSTEAAKHTGCGRYSHSFWLELGTEGTAEWYGKVPGAKYQVIEHDGKFATILAKISQVHAYMEWANGQGLPPVCFVFDTVGALWRQIQAWVDWKATQSKSAKRLLEQDPAAEISPSIGVRNQGKAMWDGILMAIHRLPGVKILLSRGQEVTKFENGQPTKEKSWSVVGHRELGYECSAWVRLQRAANPEIVGLWHPVNGINFGSTATEVVKRADFSLEWLVFERYGLDPATATVRVLHDVNDVSAIEQPAADDVTSDIDEDRVLVAAELLAAAKQATTKDEVTVLWKEMRAKGLQEIRLKDGKLYDLMTAEARRVAQLATTAPAPGGEPAEPATPAEPAAPAAPATPAEQNGGGVTMEQRAEIGRMMISLAVHSDHAQAVLAGSLIDRPVRSIGALTAAEAERCVAELGNLADLGQSGVDTVASIIQSARAAAA